MTTCSRAIGRYGLWAESHFSASVLRLFISSFMAKLFRLLEISDLLALRQQGFIATDMCDAAGVHIGYRYGNPHGYTCR